MATEVTGDITQITDEDLLRRMWQQAEDFSRKKEIRAHMYKIREQRLKDFYTSGEVLRDVQRSNSSPGLREGTPTDGIGKSNTTQSYTKTTQYTRGGESGLTHADSLTDQSFLSLKSKEIRDSESPTRDISYRTQDIVRQGDHDWKILTSKETSEDGKSHLESLIATTAGTREIDGGTNKFAALKEESKFEKNDGDENNFSRTVGGSSKSVAQEHFVSGDDNNYRTSSSKTTSSSSHVVKHFSTKSDEPQITYDRESNFGDDYDERKSTREESRTNYSTNRQVIDNSETDHLYRKNNRYQDESYTNRNDSSNYRQYKQDTSETNRKIIDTNTSQFQHDTTTDKTVEKDGTVVQRVVKIYKSNDPNLPEYAKTNIVDGTTKIVTETRTMPDGSSVTKTKYETVGSKASSDISCAQSNKTSENRRQTEERTSKKYDSRDTTSLRSNKEIDEKTSRKYQQNENDLIDNNIKSTVRITRTQYEDEVDDRSTRNNLRKSDETSTTDNVQIKTSVQSHHIDNTSSNDQNTEFINVERTVDHRKSPDKYTSSKREPESSPPGDETKVSKEHYKTTYQQEFTNKKISVEVSPQHDAFARSLRTTPDRTSPNRSTKSPSRQDRYGSSDTFTRSQTDITTTRRTTSPQKDSRSSPTRKPSSKESSPSSRQSPDRKPDRYRESPERSMYPSRINEQKTVTSETKRYTKTSKTSPSPERKEDSPRESIYTTDYCTDTIKKRKQITDRESPDRTRKSPRSESPLKYSRDKTSPAKSPSKSRSSPTKDFPSKTPSSRESSPNTDTFTRPRKTSPSKETRESSPNTDTFTRPRKTSPSKDFSKEPSTNTDTFTRRGKSSPTKEQPKESSPNTDTFTRPRKSSPSRNDKNSEPKNYRPQPDADEDDIGIKTIESSRNTEATQETVTTTVDTKRRTSGGILKNTKRPSEDKPEPEPYQETTIITTDINYVLPNTQIITDLDSNETITITIQPEERPSTLNLEETNYINELILNERNMEIRNQTTAYSPEPKPIPGKDALISPNPDESAPCEFLVSPKEPEPKSSGPVSPKKDRPLRRKDTYADKCAELLGLVSTKKDSTEIEVQRQSPKTSPERKSPSKKSPSKEVPDKSKKGPEVQEFPAQRRSPTSSPERKSPSKTPDISKKSPSKEVPDKTTKGPTVQEFPAQRRSPTSSPERKSPSKTPNVSKKSPSRESPDKSSKGSIQEFPAQRRSPTSSPERKSPSKTFDVSKKSPSPDKGPTVQEFPAQRRSPTSSPERKTSRNIPDDKISPIANKQPNEPYKKTNLQEFPAQKRSPESSPDRKTSTNQEINVTTTNITRKSSLKKPKDTNEAAPTNKQYPTRPYDASPDRKTSEYSSCDETTVVNRKSSLKKTKIQDTVRKSPTKETPNARQTPDSSPDRQSPQRKSSLKKPKTSVTEFILNEQMIIEQNSKEAAKKIYKSEDITDESDTDSDNEGGDISESESYKYIKNIESEYFPENGIETVLTTKQTTDFNETDFITATVTTETVTSKIDKEIKRPSTPSKIPTKKTPDSSPDRKTNRKTPTNATSPDRKTTTYNLIRNERIQSKQSPESSPDRKSTKKIPVKSPQTTEKKTPATKPLTKQSSNKEIPARSAQPSPDRKPVSKTPSRSSIKTPEQLASGKSSPTKFSKSPSDTKRPSISSPTPKATSVSPKTTKTTPSKPLPRRHTDESLTGKTPTKSQPKTKGTVRTVTSTKITKTTSVSPVLKKTMSNIDNKPKKKQPNKATTETESENEEYSDIELNEDGSLITNVSILDAEEFTNDTTTVQNHKTVISETKTYTSDLKINRNGSQKSPVTIKIKPEENTTSKRPSTPSNKIPVRKTPLNKKKPDIKIATKTITLTDTNTEQIVIDIQQSKSSREPSSEHVWPCPVPNDTDTGKPRYPDNVCEPDDQNTKKFKVTDIPLTEGEDVDFNQSKITDVTDEYPENYIPKSIRITDVDKVQETDESLLSVSDKVSKFLHTAEKLTKTSKKDTSTPAPKVTRPELIIDDETLISDECLLSVSDKVNKFLTTAEQLTTTTITSTERPKSPRCRNYEDNEENYIVDETDECLLSVTDKVNRFTTTVEQVASNKRSSDSKPAPKVERPDIIDVNEELREDECLLSVSDKVNKFLTTAEQLTTTTTTTKTTSSTQKETEPKYKPQEKEPTTMRQEPKRQSPIRRPPLVTESEVTTKTTTLTKQLPNENESPKKIYETPKAPRSSEAVRKAKAIFENINNTQQENVNKRNVKTWETKKVSTKDESTKLTDIGVYKKQVDDKKDEVVSMRKESLPKTEITVQRKESLPKTEITSQRKESLSKTTKNIQEDTSLKSTKLILNKPSSTVPTSLDEKPESPVEKYKKLISSKNEVNDYKRPVTPKFETKRPSSPQKPQVNGTVKEDIELTKKKHTPIQETKPRQRSISPLKDTTPRKSIEEPVITKKEISQLEEVSTTKQTKFGVVLKRTDSGRTIMTTEQRRRSMSTDPKDPNHQPCIEDIEDLGLLEQMLEKVSGYEQRRRIRAQIRVVKKLIQEGKISSSTTTKRTTVSPIRKSPERKILTSKVENTPRQESTEYNEKSYMRQTLTSEKKVNKVTDEDVLQGSTTRTSIDNTTTNFNKKMRSPSPKQRSPSPQYRTPKVTDYSQPTAAWTSRTTTSTTTNIIKKARSPSPKQRSPSPSQQNRPSKVIDYSQPTAAWSLKSTNSRTDFKKIVPKQKPQTDEQPEWVTQKILRKVDRNNTQTTTQTNQRRVTTLSELKSKKDVPKEYESSPSTKDIEPTECITSSYGVGPTDEIGRPLFGLKALRHQSSFNEKTQVRGTVVSSSYYSENGSEPVGEVTVTQYSSDPNELGIDTSRNKQRLHGLAAITTTQKFGRNSPAAVSNTRTTPLKAITTGNKETENNDITNDVISKTVTSRITRRGSVKEMSKKFIENAVESVQTERKSSYPKAGLILRTSSFKEQIAGSDFDSRASTPGMNEFSKTISLESMESANESKTTRRTDSKTFLNSQTRVTGVQDVISRMKNSTNDSEPGECADDAEARALLNKFLGAQVLMTGMESMMGKQQQSTTVERRSIVTSSKSTSKQESNTPQVSSSISHFTRPVTLADIENIWDESILRLLLTTSTSYEERRIIRARLRQVMAEQEACANIVASMVAETKATELSGMDGTTNTTSTTNRHSIQEQVETTKKTVQEGPTTTTEVTTTRITTQRSKPVSPFQKFRQLDKQNSLSSSSSAPNSPMTPGGAGGQPLFKFTDPTLRNSASTVKDRLLYWCQVKTKEYKNVQIENFSTSWADGLAFCALIHHFRPDAFDYDALTPQQRRHNFALAFRVADEIAGIAPLLDVEDMVMMRKPDWKCVFTYVQSIYRRFKDEEI
ncbi:microtubule-associated protein futsch isoform X2 [Chrysoperla carnea]|uniref:microtubule-associated protein futsch isoform X2 n=1 Tax=Chrysoperla carnea TaxID=189513 RepID=UPI001D0930B2|nr:microtubule-associated protein futsch isoform X2 [Chrysoperla carnea]